jgi:hypothetical protein
MIQGNWHGRLRVTPHRKMSQGGHFSILPTTLLAVIVDYAIRPQTLTLHTPSFATNPTVVVENFYDIVKTLVALLQTSRIFLDVIDQPTWLRALKYCNITPQMKYKLTGWHHSLFKTWQCHILDVRKKTAVASQNNSSRVATFRGPPWSAPLNSTKYYFPISLDYPARFKCSNLPIFLWYIIAREADITAGQSDLHFNLNSKDRSHVRFSLKDVRNRPSYVKCKLYFIRDIHRIARLKHQSTTPCNKQLLQRICRLLKLPSDGKYSGLRKQISDFMLH